ncbi:glycoside hydrolase family 68 protein [Sporolactobacillus shoreae]|uniref:Glycoside hydrolase family 68 protein n=1 Tax=Sporolactobacillus shoreae TaxID=1465501 RepID=A0A4Z0GNJ4_9BACL|nr:glycoside hydrolase family 68 protein [Sporolactobacillus shoreae]TGA97766.1 glycoside hydrolase family 68 protein [Sporolactobacillus shoreae]
MEIRKILKRTTAAAVVAAFLLGGSAQTFAKSNDSASINEDYGISHITRHDMLQIPNQQQSDKFKVPEFNPQTIKNIPSAKGVDAAGNPIDLDVWDSWPLQNADGTAANYHGYHIVFALAGNPKVGSDTFIYLFYQKVGDTSLDSWKNAGRVFKKDDHLNANDPILKNQSEEWSGSATLTSDGNVRLFYTDRDSWSPDSGHYGKQTLTTAQINVSQPDADTLKVDGVQDYKSIFDGDGKYYQTVQQGTQTDSDNHTLRDPHYVEDNGHKYLVFEANTGTDDGYQGDDQLNNRAYYGGGQSFFNQERAALLQSPKKNLATLANGALGIIELNDDYTLKKVMKPLITSNTITDEIERANIFKMNGKWYLFTDSRGAKMTINGIGDKDVYMLGFVSDSLTGTYKPLNKSGLVLQMGLDPNDLTWTYSHFAVPQTKGDNVVITSYMTNRGLFDDHHSTFAPSFLLNIKGSKTSIVKDSILEQGQLTVDQ